MISPVVMGVNQGLARRFGWQNDPNVTWQDIAAKAQSGNLRFAMTNPAASNSGFSALVGVASAFAGTGNALRLKDIKVDQLRKFFSGQALTAGSSGFLADSFRRSQGSLDAMINYESVLLELNSSGKLQQPLSLIYPRDGIITADYPLMLLKGSARASYEKVVAYLRAPDAQRWIMTHTDRRPANPAVQPDTRFPSRVLVELAFPSNLQVINALLDAYLNQIRAPAHAIFVLDTSGSMEGDRLNSLKQALSGLTGLDQTLTGTFSRFRNREQVTMITFSDTVSPPSNFTVDGTDPNGPSMTQIRNFVNGLNANGGTAIYSALAEAYRIAVATQAADPKLFTSVVLMTDGENHSGISANDFLRSLSRSPGASSIRTFAVLFGEGSPRDLQRIATETGGKVFDSRSTALSEVFKDIRGYQ